MLRRVAMAIIHQLFCPYILIVVTGTVVFTGVGVFRGTPHTAHWLLTMNPFYPFQIGIGLAVGFVVGQRTEWSFARWTWVVPALILVTAFAMYPIPANLTRVGYFFGWSGLPRRGMVPMQLLLTMPLYLSAAYSIAAWRGSRDRHKEVSIKPAIAN